MTMTTALRSAARCLTSVSTIAALACPFGCAQRENRGTVVSSEGAHAVLAAARSGQITMFGDLPRARGSSYIPRTAVSLRQHTFTEIGSDFDADVDSTGRRLVFASTRHSVEPDLYLKAVDGVAVTQVTSEPGADVQPAFSPDGSRIAFASNRTGNWDIWIVGLDGGSPIQVTNGAADELQPSWSPDGTQLVFCSFPADAGQWELWIADASAGATKRFIGYGLFPEWSPVNDTIVYQRARERGSRWFSIWTLTLVDGEPHYPTELAASASQAMILPTWSADGQRIAFTSTPVPPTNGFLPMPGEATGSPSASPPMDVWVMESTGRAKARLTDGHSMSYAPVFAPDGRVFLTSNRAGAENIWSLAPSHDGAMSAGQVITGGMGGPNGADPAGSTVGLTFGGG